MPTDSNSPRPELTPDAGVEEIQADIEQTRKELGETVNALSAKADVTGRVKEKVSETQAGITDKAMHAKDIVTDKAQSAQSTVRDVVTDDTGSVKRSVPVGAVIVTAGLAVIGV
ncbi:hypothetical protein C6A85_87690, partial [Mycobacterium sp. ITM-2017-0098]